MIKQRKLAYSGLGIGAFCIALLAGVWLLVAYSRPEHSDRDRIFLGKAMVACGLLDTMAFTLAGAALAETRHKLAVPVAALILAGVPLCFILVGLFGD